MELSFTRIEAKNRRNERMKLKTNRSSLINHDVNVVLDLDLDLNLSEPISETISKPSYEELLNIIECQKVELELQKNTIISLKQQLIASKPDVIGSNICF